ncbi:hypothetical protein GBM01_07220 [Yersinia pseudotuberculosis]|nr:hypothetical protein [Yersinia pseudotuberculosis]
MVFVQTPLQLGVLCSVFCVLCSVFCVLFSVFCFLFSVFCFLSVCPFFYCVKFRVISLYNPPWPTLCE